MFFNCNFTWTWCYALWSSIAISHELDATLYDLQLQFHLNLMLGSMIFRCLSTWTWCYALWSSGAFPHITGHDPHGSRSTRVRLMASGKSSSRPSLELCHRKSARRAIFKYGDACALSSGGGSAQGKTWWKPPLTRWRKCEKKLRLPFLRLKWWKGCHSKSRRTFFLIGFECKNWLLAVRT